MIRGILRSGYSHNVDDNNAIVPATETRPQVTTQKHLASLLEGVAGKTCPQRIIDILTMATRENKLTWVRDSAWHVVCLVPFLAVSFRLQLPQDPSLYAKWPGPGVPSKLDIVFMDDTKDIRLTPGAGYKKELEALGDAVRNSFEDGYDRERNERLEFLEAALRQFLPMVVSSDPRSG